MLRCQTIYHCDHDGQIKGPPLRDLLCALGALLPGGPNGKQGCAWGEHVRKNIRGNYCAAQAQARHQLRGQRSGEACSLITRGTGYTRDQLARRRHGYPERNTLGRPWLCIPILAGRLRRAASANCQCHRRHGQPTVDLSWLASRWFGLR